MQIVLIKPEKLYKFAFPNENISTYWIKDLDDSDNERELISIVKEGDSWVLTSNDICYIERKGKVLMNDELSLNTFYTLKINNPNVTSTALLYVYNENDPTLKDDIFYDLGRYINYHRFIKGEIIQRICEGDKLFFMISLLLPILSLSLSFSFFFFDFEVLVIIL